MQINSVVFALNRQINKQKYAKTINFLCAGNKVFVKYHKLKGKFNPNPPLRTPLLTDMFKGSYANAFRFGSQLYDFRFGSSCCTSVHTFNIFGFALRLGFRFRGYV